jgi:hypothetical protein
MTTDPMNPQQPAPTGMFALRCILAIALSVGGLCACSRTNQDAHPAASASASAPATDAPASAVATGPVDNACGLLTDSEVRAVFPQAASGKRNTESLQYGLDRCAWKTPTGQIGIEVSKVEAVAFEGELRAELQGAVDPRIQGALDHLRFESVAGIGDHAIAVLEKADAQRGILTDIDLLAIQRGHRMAVLMIHDAHAPVPVLEAMKTLAAALAVRL